MCPSSYFPADIYTPESYDKLRDVLTLAHELGHGINNELIREKQNALNFGTPTSTAEVASTFMEDFVLQEILRGSDDELKLVIMVMKLNDDVSTIFRQVACYTFEQELHKEFRQRGYLSKKELGTFSGSIWRPTWEMLLNSQKVLKTGGFTGAISVISFMSIHMPAAC